VRALCRDISVEKEAVKPMTSPYCCQRSWKRIMVRPWTNKVRAYSAQGKSADEISRNSSRRENLIVLPPSQTWHRNKLRNLLQTVTTAAQWKLPIYCSGCDDSRKKRKKSKMNSRAILRINGNARH